MWSPFVYSGNTYLFKLVKEDVVKIYLTDFEGMWMETLSRVDILHRFERLNPLIDSNEEQALSQVCELLQRFKEPTTFSLNEHDIDIEFSCNLDEMTIKFSLHLLKDDLKMFSKEIIIPLIQTVQYLETRQKQLCDVIDKKDKEIREYQLEKGLISRDSKVTGKFDVAAIDSFNSDGLLLKIFSNLDQFSDCFRQKHGDIFSLAPELKPKVSPPKKKLKPYTSQKHKQRMDAINSNKKLKIEK